MEDRVAAFPSMTSFSQQKHNDDYAAVDLDNSGIFKTTSKKDPIRRELLKHIIKWEGLPKERPGFTSVYNLEQTQFIIELFLVSLGKEAEYTTKK